VLPRWQHVTGYGLPNTYGSKPFWLQRCGKTQQKRQLVLSVCSPTSRPGYQTLAASVRERTTTTAMSVGPCATFYRVNIFKSALVEVVV
jgi:hypothetical protein